MNENSRQVVEEMLQQPPHLAAEYFRRNAHRITDDATYWNVLGTLWKYGGTVVQQDIWLSMFTAKRRKKQKIMKSRERRKWRKLPKRIRVYRAINDPSEIETAISWTIDRQVAEHFAHHSARVIAEKVVSKKDIFAFFDRRKESEVLILVAHDEAG